MVRAVTVAVLSAGTFIVVSKPKRSAFVVTHRQVLLVEEGTFTVAVAALRAGLRVEPVSSPISKMVRLSTEDGSSVRLEWPFLYRKDGAAFEAAMATAPAE